MAKFKVGDRIRVIEGQRSGRFKNGVEDIVTKVVTEDDGNIFVHGEKLGGGWLEFRFELVHPFTAGCVVRCDDASGTDLEQDRLYGVNKITDGGALILNVPGAKPYRHTRFSLSSNDEWVKQRIDEIDTAQAAINADPQLSVQTSAAIAISLPENQPGWDISVSGTSASPTINCEPKPELPFKAGDKVVCVDAGCVPGGKKKTEKLREGNEYIVTRIAGGFLHLADCPGDWTPSRFRRADQPPKFKQGDRVVCIKAVPNGKVNVGDEFFVKAATLFGVQLDGEHCSSLYGNAYFELAKPLEVGDHVRCVYEGSGFKIGEEFTIAAVEVLQPHSIVRRDVAGYSGGYEWRFLRTKKPAVKSPPKFKAGDRVVCIIPRGTMIEKGCEYIVREVFPNLQEYSRPQFGSGHCVELRGATSDDRSRCDEARFELATPFKSGDRVRCVNNEVRSEFMPLLSLNSEYTIKGDVLPTVAGVRIAEKGGEFYDKDRFVRVKPKPNPFKVGDFVVCDDPSHNKPHLACRLVKGGVYVVKMITGDEIGVEAHGSTYPTCSTELWHHRRFSRYPGTVKYGPSPIAAAIKNAAIGWSPSIFTAAGSGVPQTQFRCVNSGTPTNGFKKIDTRLTSDERAMADFLGICIPSLSPDSFQSVVSACESLCASRGGLNCESVKKCIELASRPLKALSDFETLVNKQADDELRSQIETSFLQAQTLAGMNHPSIQSAKHRLFNEKQHSHRAGKTAELREKIATASKNPYGVAYLGRERVAIGCIGPNQFFPTSEEGYVKFHRQESLSS